jgi:hypothetical protein
MLQPRILTVEPLSDYKIKGIAWAEGQDIAPHELYDMGVLTPWT